MTYDGCSRASFCTVRGTLTIELVDHVKMGRLQLGDASCVNISLSQHAIQQAERRPGRFQKLSGKVKHGQMDENMTSVTVNGRRIGLSQCGDFYVFVE